jgi:hypothetical protein
MTSDELIIRQKLKDDFDHYSNRCLSIRTKEGGMVPLQLNEAQKYIHQQLEKQLENTGKIRALVLKGRQQGVSTYSEARFYWKVTHRRGVKAFILTHEAESTAALFEIAQRYHDNCNELVKPSTGASSAKELYFDGLDSGYKVGTAGNKSVGRGTTIQYFHGSEVAFWPHASEHAKGILQAVPDARDTEIILESTGNGIGNYFHQQWQLAERGESEYQAIFVPWYWQTEYTKPVPIEFKATDDEQMLAEQYGLNHGQLQFRRSKIADLSVDGVDGTVSFKQEYPFNAIEAFQVSGGDTLINPECVMNARQQKIEGHGGIIIGVDPARYGEDRTSIIYRQGRKAYNLISYSKKNTMEVAGIVHTLIERDNPAQVAVDVGGLGAGVVDRLIELGHGDVVVAVNAGSSPLDQDKYKNRRAEMWGELKSWLNDTVPVQVPDSDSLHSDLCAPFYSYDSNSRLVIERKEEMRKRGVRSPDEADALCLTFAEPIRKAKATYKTINTFTGDTITGY